jgi:hypothetical protein
MLNEQTALKIAHDWIEAWNQHDLEAILSHYDDAIEFTSPFIAQLLQQLDGTVRGKVALGRYFSKGLAAFPDLNFELISVFIGVNSVVIYYRSVRNLLAAEWMQINADGLVTHVNAHYTVN